jgi:tetratricopeptide (TPR) repeat protein
MPSLPLLESSQVRTRSIPILVLLATVLAASADVIHLKNGHTIWADHVRENKNRVDYDVGEATYAIPRSAVERVDAGGAPPEYAGSGSAAAPAAPDYTPPAPSFRHEADVVGKVIHDGQVDTAALESLERDKPEVAATGYFLAGKHEGDHGNFPQAQRYFESALRFQPDNVTLLIYYAAVLMRTGHAGEALSYGERAASIDPNSPDALAMLGFVQYANDRTPDAIRSWKESLKLRPDAKVSQYLARAEREAKAESEYSLRESSHFTLHFEGKQISQSFPHDVLASLERAYDDLARDLGSSPSNSILVTLYNSQAFFDVTQAPSWSSAVNDGKLRIPIRGIDSVTPELARVLKHELTHTFVAQMSSGRCPTWLQEGIAQVEEGKSSAPYGHQLAQLFSANSEIPLNGLEGGFMAFSSVEATLAYAESLATVEYIRDTYGMGDLARVLELIGQGSSTEAALRSILHVDYSQLRDEEARWLKNRYGE